MVYLAIPVRHRKQRSLRPDLRARIRDPKTDLLQQFPDKSVLPTLLRLDTSARVGPESPRYVEPVPVKPQEQNRLGLVEDERPDTLT